MRVPIRPRDVVALVLVGAFGVAASGTHVVSRGETLGEIAASRGTTVAALVSENGLSDPNLILVGQELRIPGVVGTTTTQTHVVQRGDTLSEIAARYGTTVAAIAQANSLSDPDRIRIGQALRLPGGSSTGTPPTSGGSGGGSGGTGAPGTSTQRVGQYHAVRSGETLAGIARTHGIASGDLAAWNGIVDGKLYALAKLKLWDPGALPALAPSESGAGSHVVAAGESLSTIAARYGTTAAAIAAQNGLADLDHIVVGQKLAIPGSSGGGGAVCPVAGATFVNDWGFPRSNGRAHAGNDLFAPRGTPVVAPVAGTVEFATGSIGGHQFRLTAPDGTRWYGSHLDRFGTDGQVSAGTVIGYVGDSGNARGSRTHLHFEIHPRGEAANPYPLLIRICR